MKEKSGTGVEPIQRTATKHELVLHEPQDEKRHCEDGERNDTTDGTVVEHLGVKEEPKVAHIRGI